MTATLGILTSGGDCAGLNAVIRAATDAAALRGWRVLGLRNGHLGLLASPPDVVSLTADSVRSDLLRLGGTMLGTTTKGDPFNYPGPDGRNQDVSEQVRNALKALGITHLLVIGGDGSMRVFDRLLAPSQIPWVGVPKTIDNDVPGTEFAVGFITAVTFVGEALDRLSSTAASHRRIMLLEAMGRDSGFLALFGGVAGGADVILLPEFPYDIGAVAAHIKNITHDRPSPVLVVVAEGVLRPDQDRRRRGSVGPDIAAELEKLTGFDARSTVLGHVQRGGSPVAFDRLLASSFGVHGVELLARGETRKMVAWRGGVVSDLPMAEAVTGPRFVTASSPLVRTALNLGIYLGESVCAEPREAVPNGPAQA